LSDIPKNPKFIGRFIKDSSGATFLIDKNTRYLINTADIPHYGQNALDAQHVPNEFINSIDNYAVASRLFRINHQDPVYYLRDGMSYHMTSRAAIQEHKMQIEQTMNLGSSAL